MNERQIIIDDERCLRTYHENMQYYKHDFYSLVDLYLRTSWPKIPLFFFKWIRNAERANKEIELMNQQASIAPAKEKTRTRAVEKR